MDARHHWCYTRVAGVIGVDEETVSNACSDCLQELTSFFQDPKQNVFLLKYTADPASPKFCIYDTQDSTLGDGIFYFIRVSERATSTSSVEADLFFGYMLGNNFLQTVDQILGGAFIPAVRTAVQAGDTAQLSAAVVQDFFTSFEQFQSAMRQASQSLSEVITLAPPPAPLDTLQPNSTQLRDYASDPKISASAVSTLNGWIGQVSAFVSKADQVRVEAHTGPGTETGYWRRRMVLFHCVLDQVRKPQARAVVALVQLTRQHTDLVRSWASLTGEITAAAGEARNNLKYLQTLDRILEPLYRGDPRPVIEALPGITSVLQAMHSVAHYYSTGNRLEGLFAKITTQIIICCKEYLWAATEAGVPPVGTSAVSHAAMALWQCDYAEMRRRMDDCLQLHKCYREQVRLAKEKAEETNQSSDGASAISFSETAILADLDSFCQRVMKLRTMFLTAEQFASLQRSTVPGLSVIAASFSRVMQDVKRRPMDLLDHLSPQFDTDYATFTQRVAELESRLAEFVREVFSTVTSSNRAIELIEVFEAVLQRDGLKHLLEEQYNVVFDFFEKEIEHMRRTYELCKENPPLPRNTPRVAGNILWARQLYAQIAGPIERLRVTSPAQLETERGQRVVRIYNSMTKVLAEFEQVWMQNWTTVIDRAAEALRLPLLERDQQTRRLSVHLEPIVLQLCREARFMRRLNIKVPEAAQVIIAREERLLLWRNRLQQIANGVLHVQERTPPSAKALLAPIIRRMIRKVAPGCSQITWSSLSVDAYIDEASRAVQLAIETTEKVIEIIEYRALPALKQICDTCFLYIPNLAETPPTPHVLPPGKSINGQGAGSASDISSDQVPSISEWVTGQIHFASDVAKQVADNSLAVQQAVEDCCTMLMARLTPEGRAKHAEVTLQFTKLWYNKVLAAVHVATESSLSLLSRRLAHTIPQQARVVSTPGPGERQEEQTEQVPVEVFDQAMLDYGREWRGTMTVTGSGDSTESVFMLPKTIADFDDGSALPLFHIEVRLALAGQQFVPSWDRIQTDVRRGVQSILSCCSDIPMWSTIESYPTASPSELIAQPMSSGFPLATATPASVAAVTDAGAPTNLAHPVLNSLSIVKSVIAIQGGLAETEKQLGALLQIFNGPYTQLRSLNREQTCQQFSESNPSLTDFNQRLSYFTQLIDEIQALPSLIPAFCFVVSTAPIKASILAEIEGWRREFGRLLNAKSRALLQAHQRFVEDCRTLLQRQISDIDDVGVQMENLGELQRREAELDHRLGPIEEGYAMLTRYGLPPPQEEADTVDSLRYKWRQLIDQADGVQAKLTSLQGSFRSTLIRDVREFRADVEAFAKDYAERGPNTPGIQPKVAAERVREFQSSFEVRQRKWNAYTRGEELFGLPVTKYPELENIQKELKLLGALYGLYVDVLTTVNSYGSILWADVDFDAISQQVAEYQTRCRRLPRSMRDWQAYIELSKTIDDFVTVLPLLQMLRHPAVRQRHWDRISELGGVDLDVTADNFCVQQLIDADLLRHAEEVEDICNAAVKETDIETKLNEVSQQWVNMEFQFAPFKNRGELTLKPDATSELISQLEDTQMVLSSLSSSRYNVPFKRDIMSWVQRLSTASEVLDLWLQVQNLWVYLEAVFSGGDIARQLPAEAKRFVSVDKHWCQIMATATQAPNVIHLTNVDESLRELLPLVLEHLEICQKSLAGYLETKRNAFPRFYFISESQLLEILGQQSDPQAIQAHLSSIFDSVYRAQFDRVDRSLIVSLNSSVGDVLPLTQPIHAQGNIETWLNALVTEMRASVREVVRTASIQCDVLGLNEFIHSVSAQGALLGIQFSWTRLCEAALAKARTDKMAMQGALKQATSVLNELVELTKKDLSTTERILVETLIIIQVHSRDITDHLVKARVRSPIDFEWTKQTRFYWDQQQDDAVVRITDVNFRYNHEFLANQDRLVITPLTDRCYITLAQALGMKLGGAPAGPAGTGKTETVKDLGRALGMYVVVINASNEMDSVGLGRLFRGTAQSGAFIDFDEFNRVELPVLSVAAQQVGSILAALKAGKSQFVYTDGDTVPLDPGCGFFITMNPGYAGRQELPENLKAIFRSVAMTRPDKAIIMRVKLAAAGFLKNQELAQKFSILYMLCEEQLSKSVHYDWGLRNILSVLRTCGGFRRRQPELSEEQVLMATLRDMNLSKLIHQDEPLFLSLIDDLFPDLVVVKAQYPEVERAVTDVLQQRGLVVHPDQMAKIIQLHETAQVRHGIMVLGPSGSGKTTCIDVLASAYGTLGADSRHTLTRMNPKAITCPQMFGLLDASTNDWRDGIFSAIWRRLVKRANDHNWFVLDGPVDTIWIESLNTVLDDNKTLTLANGDRIPMAPKLKLLFEVDSLANASPATVSRAGMIFVSDNALGWEPVFTAWCNNRGDNAASVVRSVGQPIIGDLVTWMQKTAKPVMSMPLIAPVQSMLRLLDSLLPEVAVKGVAQSRVLSEAHVQRLSVFCLMWAFGGLLETKDREGLQQCLMKFVEDGIPLQLPPVRGTASIFDYMVNDDGDWVAWSTLVPDYQYPHDSTPDYTRLVVPTLDIVRTTYLVKHLIQSNFAPLLVGESGTAKTVTMNHYLSQQDREAVQAKTINFSSETTPLFFQRTIESFVEKRMGTTYGPPAGRRGINFIDNINIIEPNEWGDSPTDELLRQMMEFRGFYSLERPGEWVHLADILWAGAMPHPGGGRNDIPMRLKRHFVPINLTLPSETSIAHIYGTIIQGHFCQERGFSPEVIQTSSSIVRATHQVWEQTKQKMLPTPDKFHYVFNLRDFSNVVQGLLRAESEPVDTPAALVSLWGHEMRRVMPDKFTNQEDKTWFEQTLESVVEQVFGEEFIPAIAEPIYFCNFMRDIVESDDPDVDPFMPRIYDPVRDTATVRARLEGFMAQYNEQYRRTPLDLVLFDEAIAHLVRIVRILSTPCGHGLLVGVGGSGKQSLTRLAAFVAGCETFTLQVTRNYTENNLMDDLRALYRLAGVQNKGVAFLFSDADVKEEGFLEYINNMLTSGVVPGLFARDEVEQIVNDLRPVFKKACPRVPDTNDALWDFFISRCRQNLHLIICFSPVGDLFRQRARKFPGLISGCTTDWFLPWPYQALVEVAEKFLANVEIVGDEGVKGELVKHFATVHTAVAQAADDYFQRFRRHAYVTPKSFLQYIQSFIPLYEQKRQVLDGLHQRLSTGLEKLETAAKDVATIKVDLQEKEVDLKIAQERAAEMLQEITASAAVAEAKKAEVQAVKDELQKVSEAIEAQRAEAEADLSAALPALEAAEAALKQIHSNDITTLKKLLKPPPLIQRIMDAVLLLLHQKLQPLKVDPNFPDQQLPVPSWQQSLAVMTQGNFLNSLLNYDRDAITDEMVELLDVYLSDPNFTMEAARKSCGNVAGLCAWVRAMCTYHNIAKVVEPKRAALREAESKKRAAMADLADAQAQLDSKQAALDALMAKYDQCKAQKQQLQDEADLTRRRLSAAEALISGLSGERVRWASERDELTDRIRKLAGDIALCSAFLSYAGPFSQEMRSQLINVTWQQDLVRRGIPLTPGINVTKFLADDAQIGQWQLEGLPTDDLSTQNGIIVTTAGRYPLMIDPQGQAKQWIRNREEQNGLTVTSESHRWFRQHLEDALSNGRPLLIEDVEEALDPILTPILEKQFLKSGTTLKVKIGDKECDVMPGFSLYITSKLPNPHWAPEIFARTSVIDFSVTLGGLEAQLLTRVVNKEKRELEDQRRYMLEEVTVNKRRKLQLEEDLLNRLTSTQGNLLDDETLIDVLAQTKRTTSEVDEKLQSAMAMEQRINDAREEYRQVAIRGSLIYFLITEMRLVEHMYQISLFRFLRMFDEAIDMSEDVPVQSKRIASILRNVTYHTWQLVTRGIFERHKLLFTLQLALKIGRRDGSVTQLEFDCLVKGGAALDLVTVRKKPVTWLSDDAWLNVMALSEVPAFKVLPDHIAQSEAAWKRWIELDAPEKTAPPADFITGTLSPFQMLLLVRSLRYDRAMLAASTYVASVLGAEYNESCQPDLHELYAAGRTLEPSIFILSAGSDPTGLIETAAHNEHVDLDAISMGQGQEIRAMALIRQGMQQGSWVLLQNCHLGLPFMAELDSRLAATEAADEETKENDLGFGVEEINPNFRLWITTEPHPKFPINLLQRATLLTNEPPTGMRAGLRRSFNWVTQDMLESVDHQAWPKLLYDVCFIHSVVQERRSFGPLGWNGCLSYEFNQSDLAASVSFICHYLDQLEVTRRPISWPTVRYMICEVHYGGRITDDFDRRLMNTFGAEWFSDRLFDERFNYGTPAYTVPTYKDVTVAREHVEKLPALDTPEVYGLHPNAEISFRGQQTRDVLGTIMATQPKQASGGAGRTREDIVDELASETLAKLPSPFDLFWVEDRIKQLGGRRQPLNVFLSQEVDFIQRLLVMVRRDLSDLRLAIAGSVIMTPHLISTMNALYDAVVPDSWRKISWASSSFGFWLTGLSDRCEQLRNWLEKGRPAVFWLTGFFRPTSFLTAVKQEITRAHKWPLDSVNIISELTRMDADQVTSPPQEGVYVSGLFLEGAAWDRRAGKLVEQQPQQQHVTLPVLHIYASNQPVSEKGFYRCPVYKTPQRTEMNYIFDVLVPTDRSPNKWIMRGTAILASKQ